MRRRGGVRVLLEQMEMVEQAAEGWVAMRERAKDKRA